MNVRRLWSINLDYKQRQLRVSCSHPMKKSHAKKKATSHFTNMQPRNFPLAALIERTGKFCIYVWKQPYNYENWTFLDSWKTFEESKGPIMSSLAKISDNINGRLRISKFLCTAVIEINKYFSLLTPIFNLECCHQFCSLSLPWNFL